MREVEDLKNSVELLKIYVRTFVCLCIGIVIIAIISVALAIQFQIARTRTNERLKNLQTKVESSIH